MANTARNRLPGIWAGLRTYRSELHHMLSFLRGVNTFYCVEKEVARRINCQIVHNSATYGRHTLDKECYDLARCAVVREHSWHRPD